MLRRGRGDNLWVTHLPPQLLVRRHKRQAMFLNAYDGESGEACQMNAGAALRRQGQPMRARQQNTAERGLELRPGGWSGHLL